MFILGVVVGGAAVWFGKDYTVKAIDWIKGKIG